MSIFEVETIHGLSVPALHALMRTPLWHAERCWLIIACNIFYRLWRSSFIMSYFNDFEMWKWIVAIWSTLTLYRDGLDISFANSFTISKHQFRPVWRVLPEIYPRNIVTDMQVRNKATSGLKLMHELQLSKAICSHEQQRRSSCVSEEVKIKLQDRVSASFCLISAFFGAGS